MTLYSARPIKLGTLQRHLQSSGIILSDNELGKLLGGLIFFTVLYIIMASYIRHRDL